MTSILLALALGAPEIWVSTQGFDRAACDSNALAAALLAQRPTAVVRAWQREEGAAEAPPAGAIRVRLAGAEGVTFLEISGVANPTVRTLSGAEGCERNVEIAALIVDGALDALLAPEAVPSIESLAPPIPLLEQIQIGAALGGGIEQGPLGWGPSLDAEGVARFRFYELTLDADVRLPASTTGSSILEGGNVSLSVTGLATELGLGVSPQLGPGRLSADLLLGLSLDFASGGGGGLHAQNPQTATELFAGLRLGYVFDLPFGLFAGARVEERLAPEQTTLSVGNAPDDLSATTRTWTFQALGLLGYRFL